MVVLFQVIEVIVTIALTLFLFSKVNGRRLTAIDMLIAFSIRFAIAVALTTVELFIDVSVAGYLSYPLYMVILSFLLLRPLPKTLIIFYGLFPIVIWNLFYRSISFFVLPAFGSDFRLLDYELWGTLFDGLATILALLFLKWLQYDFSQLRTEFLDSRDKKLLSLTNWIMVSYYLGIQLLTYLEFIQHVKTLAYREFMVILCLVLFMGIINRLDKHVKDTIQEKLNFQQSLQLRDMENYSNHIEELYKEVRSFRHDYTNLLTTLRLGIENEDIQQIKEIYDSVLKDSNRQFRHHKYDISRLAHVQNSALKSLLAAKFIQATESAISVTLEVPDSITPQGMELVDFITIVSILCDNAIEAAKEANIPDIQIAYLTIEEKQLFIIENSMKPESVDIAELYDFGVSSKGADRGIGLHNVTKILNQYLNVSINTTSQNHIFRQVLEINL